MQKPKKQSNQGLTKLAVLFSALVKPSILYGIIPKKFDSFLKSPETVEVRGGPCACCKWYCWKPRHAMQMVYSITSQIVQFGMACCGFYLIVTFGDKESRNVENGNTDNFVFLVNFGMAALSSICDHILWICYSTPELARIWKQFCQDEYLKKCNLFSRYNYKRGLIKLWTMAMFNYSAGVLTVGVQIYAMFMPFTEFVPRHYLIMYLLIMTYTILASCWGMVATSVHIQVTSELAMEFSKEFQLRVEDLLKKVDLERKCEDDSLSYDRSSCCLTYAKASIMDDLSSTMHHYRPQDFHPNLLAPDTALFEPDHKFELPLICINGRIEKSCHEPVKVRQRCSVATSLINGMDMEEIEEDLDLLRRIYRSFRGYYERFNGAVSIQLTITYAYTCVASMTSTYSAINVTFEGGFYKDPVYAVSQWLSTICAIAHLTFICELGHRVGKQLRALMNELTQHPIRPVIFDCMPLNRQLLVTGLTTIVTYLIVLIQFKQGDPTVKRQ